MLGKQLKSSLMMVQAEWLMVVQVGLSGWLRYYFAKGDLHWVLGNALVFCQGLEHFWGQLGQLIQFAS